jgi:hypothetical protein
VVRLDGSPRIPTDEGVATALRRDRIELDGRRSYPVDPAFKSFSTYSGQLEPMVTRQGQYVQLGVRSGRAIWMAGIAAVVTQPQRAVYYIGRLAAVRDRTRLVFVDGTVLRLGAAVTTPKPAKQRVQVRIDPDRHRVVEIVSL